MRWTRQRSLMLAALPLLLVVAASGASLAQDDDDEEASVSGPVSVFGFSYETGDQVAQVRVDHVRELHPGLELTFSESGWDEREFLTSLESSSPPDVVYIPRDVLGTFVARRTLQPVDECMAAHEVDPEVFRPAAIDQVTVDGSIYGFPQFFNTRLWLINEEVMADAGLDPESFDWSDWDAIAAANEQLTQTDGDRVTRIGIDPKLPEFLPLWARANGVDLLSEDGLTSQLEDPKVAEALAFTASLLEPAGGQARFLDFRDTWDFFGEGNQFTTDELGAFPMELWYVNVLADVSPDIPLGTATFMERDGGPITWANGDAFAIVSETPNAEAACAFAAAMSDAETWIAAARARAETRAEEGKPNTGVYTANREADEEIFGQIVDLTDWPIFEEAVQTILEGQENAFSLPPSPAAAEFDQAWRGAVEAVVARGAAPEEALAEADATAQSAIDAAASR
jgi:multiple sugar transport system substrate-binding protein